MGVSILMPALLRMTMVGFAQDDDGGLAEFGFIVNAEGCE